MAFDIKFDRDPARDEVHCYITYRGPEGDFVARGKVRLKAVRERLARLERRYGTPHVAIAMGCSCSSNAISGALDLAGCECAYKRAARMMGVEPVGFLRKALRRAGQAAFLPMALPHMAVSRLTRRRGGGRAPQQALPPLTDQSLSDDQQQQESENTEAQAAESEASGMFEIGVAPLVAWKAYQERKRLARIAKSRNPRAANAAKTLVKAKGGDPKAKRKIAILNRRAKKGDPVARDAMNRLKTVNAMAKVGPGLSLRDYYRAGLS